MNRLSLLFIAGLLAAGLQTTRAQLGDVQIEKQLASAKHKATVDGDLKGAIEEYKAIVAGAGANRTMAAQALIGMAESYRKLGDPQSRTTYERVLREYSDQKDAAALSLARLGGADGSSQQSGLALRKVVWPSGNIQVGTVSQDGRRVTYADWVNPSTAEWGTLRVRDLAAGTDRPLTSTQEGQAGYFPATSRDGTQVAYQWCSRGTTCDESQTTGELRIASLQGTGLPPARRVFKNDDVRLVPMDWSPDGKWIAVIGRRMDRVAQVGLLAVADGSLRVLRSVDWRGPEGMFFSPDGRDLAFDLPANDSSDHRDVFVLAADGSREVRAVTHLSNNIVMGWSPDGTHLLFASDRSGSVGLWALAFAAGKPAGTPELIKAGIGNVVSLGVTGAGALYMRMRADARDIEIASIDLATGKQTAPPVKPIERFTGTNSDPAWSPDGKSLAYLSTRLGETRTLAIRSSATGEVRELAMRPSLTYLQGLSWAPDGRSLAIRGTDLKGREGIFHIDAGTGEVTPILVPTPQRLSYEGFFWSPAGTRLYFHSQTGVIYERDLSLGTQREVARGYGPISLSPDGRWIATQRSDGSTKTVAIVLVPVEGGEPRELLRISQPQWVNNTAIPWTPDGRAVLVRKMLIESGAQSELWLVPVSGEPPRKLDFDANRVPPYAQGKIALHPDGRQLAHDSGKWTAEVWVLENFLPALKASR